LKKASRWKREKISGEVASKFDESDGRQDSRITDSTSSLADFQRVLRPSRAASSSRAFICSGESPSFSASWRSSKNGSQEVSDERRDAIVSESRAI